MGKSTKLEPSYGKTPFIIGKSTNLAMEKHHLL